MQIIRLSVAVSKMSNEEIRSNILKSLPPEQALPFVNEALRRNDADSFYITAHNPKYVNDPIISKILLKVIVQNQDDFGFYGVISDFLEFSNSIDKDASNKLFSCAIANPKLCSLILLHKKTPYILIDQIINALRLSVSHQVTIDNNVYLQSIIEDLKEGARWDNERSGLLMCTRIAQYPNDKFITEISKYDLSPSVASILINASKLYQVQNKELGKNLEQNKNQGIKLAQLGSLPENTSAHVLVPAIIDNLNTHEYDDYIEYVWDFVKNKMQNNPAMLKDFFTLYWHDENIILKMIGMRADLFPEIIDFITKLSPTEISTIKNTPAYSDIINNGLKNANIKDLLLNLPENYFESVDLDPENYSMVQNKFWTSSPEIAEEDDDTILSSTNNWYIKYALAEELLKEAGWKENIATSIMAALIMILSGSSLASASQKTKISEEEITNAMKDNDKMNQAKKIKEKLMEKNFEKPTNTSTPSFEEIYNFIKTNEGVSYKAYRDPAGNISIGIGFNMDRPFAKAWFQKLGIDYRAARNGTRTLTDDEVRKLFQQDAVMALSNAKKFVTNFDNIPHDMQLVLIDMSFNMGESRLNKFIKFKQAIENYDFQTAANEMKNSRWYSQVKDRGVRLVAMVEKLPSGESSYIATSPEKPLPPRI